LFGAAETYLVGETGKQFVGAVQGPLAGSSLNDATDGGLDGRDDVGMSEEALLGALVGDR
jgi:hypothetical protein